VPKKSRQIMPGLRPWVTRAAGRVMVPREIFSASMRIPALLEVVSEIRSDCKPFLS
jgi:hypothetical protein